MQALKPGLWWTAGARSKFPRGRPKPEDAELSSSSEGAAVINWCRPKPALFLLPGLLRTRTRGATTELILLSPGRKAVPTFRCFVRSCTNHLSTCFGVTDRRTQPGTHSPGLWLQHGLCLPLKLLSLRILTHHSRATVAQCLLGIEPRCQPTYQNL